MDVFENMVCSQKLNKKDREQNQMNDGNVQFF